MAARKAAKRATKATKAGGAKKAASKAGLRSHGKPWTAADMRELRTLSRQRLSARQVAERLGRTLDSVKSKASEEQISLNQGSRKTAAKRR
jgi:hypothetical protein